MNHKPISCHNVGLSFPQKVCFEGLTTQLYKGSRIALMGPNGSGKTTLLKMLKALLNQRKVILYCQMMLALAMYPRSWKNSTR